MAGRRLDLERTEIQRAARRTRSFAGSIHLALQSIQEDKTMKSLIKCLALAFAIATAAVVHADVVYDNSSLRGVPEQFAGMQYEFGEEIVLAGNGTYIITNFQYEFFGYGPDFANGNAQVRLRFYQNDGLSGTPGSLIFDSGASPVSETTLEGAVLEYRGIHVGVPKNFTWTVEFTGLTPQSIAGLQSAGLDLYQVPTVGLTYDDYWEKSGPGGTWELRLPQAGQPRINFGCRVQAVYTGAATITQPPQSTTICPNGTATLSVTAIGSSPLAYQWFKGVNPISGATASNLVLNGSTPGVLDNYSVRVTNAFGMVQSTPAIVSAEAITPMYGVVVYDNSATRETPQRFSESDYEFGDEIVLAGTISDSTWEITNFKFEYFGYGIDFTNGNVQVALRFYANDGVDGRPGTQLYSSGYSVIPPTGPGGSVLEYNGLSVILPARNFTWTVDFVGLGPASSGGLQGGGLDLYGPPTIGQNYNDFWERSGPGLSWKLRSPAPGQPPINFGARAEATITGPPVITKQPTSLVVCLGDSATLSVNAIGSSRLTYQWYHNGSSVPNATNNTFSIAWVDTNETGGYSVMINSCLGATTSQAVSLNVSDPSQTSPCLRIERGASGFAIVSWTAFYGSAWTLQEAITPDGPGNPVPWVNSSATPTLMGSRYTVTVPTTLVMRVYRLKKP